MVAELVRPNACQLSSSCVNLVSLSVLCRARGLALIPHLIKLLFISDLSHNLFEHVKDEGARAQMV